MTTVQAERRGAREANPLFAWAEQPTQAIVAAGAVGGSTYLLHRVHEHHPKLAIIVTLVGASVAAGAAIHNARAQR